MMAFFQQRLKGSDSFLKCFISCFLSEQEIKCGWFRNIFPSGIHCLWSWVPGWIRQWSPNPTPRRQNPPGDHILFLPIGLGAPVPSVLGQHTAPLPRAETSRPVSVPTGMPSSCAGLGKDRIRGQFEKVTLVFLFTYCSFSFPVYFLFKVKKKKCCLPVCTNSTKSSITLKDN